MSKIQGHPYKLAAVGCWDELQEQARAINRQQWKAIDKPTLVIDSMGAHGDNTLERAAAERAAGKEVWWSQYHYTWSYTDTGAPARVREVRPDQLERWAELAPYRGATGHRPALLWVRETMPERPEQKMVDRETGLPLENQNPAK